MKVADPNISKQGGGGNKGESWGEGGGKKEKREI